MVDVRGYPLSGSLDAKKVQMLLVVFLTDTDPA
jgi:hypothetical protein